jgi:hypothetical protein
MKAQTRNQNARNVKAIYIKQFNEGGIKMADKLKEAIGVLKKVRHWIDYGAGELEPTANAVIEAIDTVVAFYESPPAESEEIPETLKGKAYDYMTQMKTHIKNQHTMSPDLFIANAKSIVCYAYSAGVDFVVDALKLEKKG